jgi:hypothetical protein
MKNNLYGIAIMMIFLAAGCSVGGSTPTAQHGDVRPTITVAPAIDPEDSAAADEAAGLVKNEAGVPLENAIVRLQGTDHFAITDAGGKFLLAGLPKGQRVRLTAYSPGYFINEADVIAGQDGAAIILTAHASSDNTAYEFLPSGTLSTDGGENSGCAKCHAATGVEKAAGITLPFDQWQIDAHALSAANPRFLSMYSGTDLDGRRSPPTTYFDTKDYGPIPLAPKTDENYFGPGFKLDFPKSSGNCSSCHAPLAAVGSPYDTDPNKIAGVGLEGSNCDFCHKVWDVKLMPGRNMPAENTPGLLSIEFRRPSGEHQLFIGPYDDVAPGEDTYSALQKKSDFCAACHTGSFWDVKIYNSYGEWLASPYADPADPHFKTCQDCHMPPNGVDHFAQIEKGGLVRDPATIFSHKMLGASDIGLLTNTAKLDAAAKREADLIKVDISVFNENGGHDIPTDSPLRQILLSVQATDAEGRPLRLASGPTLPEWTGELADTPGLYFAKILEELWTEVSPSGAYWMQTRLLEDTRLKALETRKAQFSFEVPEGSQATIKVSLIYRRAFARLMEQKGWNTPDILMEETNLTVP